MRSLAAAADWPAMTARPAVEESTTVVRLGVAGIVGVLLPPKGTGPEAAADAERRVQRHYAPLLDMATSAVWAGEVAVVWAGAPSRMPLAVVAGVPVGASGEATDEEILTFLADPAVDAAPAGVWSMVWVRDGSVRIVTSRAPVHTVTEARGAMGTAWASRNAVAHAMAGTRPGIAVDRAGEFIALDYVLGADDLLVDGKVLAEGTVVDLDRGASRAWQPQPLSVRYAAGRDTTSEQLRAVVGDVAGRMAQVTGSQLALTAGRDSALLLSCLVERGRPLPTFTMGWPDLPDARGAAAVARAVGVPHRVTPTSAYDGRPVSGARATERWIQAATARPDAGRELLDAVAKWSIWTEGLDHPRNLLIGWIDWPASRLVTMTGSGGEIGRAFYWPDQIPDHPLDTITGPWRPLLRPEVWDSFRERMSAEMTAIPGAADAASVLDFVYLRGRMRKWLNRGAAFRDVAGTMFPYLEPSVVRALLGIPREQRLDGSTFDGAIDLSSPNLHHTGQAGSRPRWRSRIGRGPLRRLAPRIPSDWPLLAALVRESMTVSALHRSVFRDEWWGHALATGATDPGVRPPLWNYVALVAAERAFA